jgi:uncharacterized iron-regulated membrane protein
MFLRSGQAGHSCIMSAPSAPVRPQLRRRILTIHRWLSLGAAIFWLLQAISGVLIVFHWEIGDALVPGAHRPTDLAAIERRIDALAPRGGGATVASVWTTAGAGDRYDIFVEDDGGVGGRVRIAGDGTVLHTGPSSESTWIGTVVAFHHDLLGGDTGSWIVSISGILLFSNLALGLATAWPRRGTWRAALKPAARGPVAARLYAWHRALGLWVAVPALLLVGTGTLYKFEHGLGALIGAEAVALPPNPPAREPVGFATAAGAALAAIPGSTLTAVTWPSNTDATYTVRVRAPGEIRRAYGGSIVLVDANEGGVRGVYPISEAEPARGFMSALVPIHTGEAGGLAGRLLVLALGLWLISMIAIGTLLWAKRRKRRTGPA